MRACDCATRSTSVRVSSLPSSWPGPHAVAFAHRKFGHALVGVEGQRDLAQVDVAVEHELVGRRRRAVARTTSRRPRRAQATTATAMRGFLFMDAFPAGQGCGRMLSN
jgi:hypothetical protein